MTIHVTARDIDAGIPGDACRCPIALAMRRAAGVAAEVLATSVFLAGDPWTSHRLPEAACRFVRAFDAGMPVEPCAFDFPDLVTARGDDA